MTSRIILAALSLSLVVGCASHEGEQTKPKTSAAEPEPDPDPEPAPKVAIASIASVQMIADCPHDDPPPPPPPAEPAADQDKPSAIEPAPGAMAVPTRRRAMPGSPAHPGDSEFGGGWSPPCTQSTMQIEFRGQGEEPGKVTIRRVAVIDPQKGIEVGTVEARAPTAWTEAGRYESWNQVIPAGGDRKASYRLSLPDWSGVEQKLGADSFGVMFVLEVELDINGQSQTVRSPEFPREREHVIVT